MKYLALDVECWGLKKRIPTRVAMLTMMAEDTNRQTPLTDLPHFTAIFATEEIEGEPVALAMNAWIIDAIARFANKGRPIPNGRGPAFSADDNPFPVMWMSDGWKAAIAFLKKHFGDGKVTAAGKNPRFDIDFLPHELQRRMRHRLLDPTILVTDFLQDEVPPNLAATKQRNGVLGLVRHDTYNDCMDTIASMRPHYGHFTAAEPFIETTA